MEYLYLHFPFCRHLCNYCDFYKKIPSSPQELEEFHRYLEQSVEKLKRQMDELKVELRPLKSLYLGGGTPSLWGSAGADFLDSFLERHQIKLREDIEFTLEVNPGSWNHEGLKRWREVGANRYSLGIQALDSRFIKVLDRVHDLDEVYRTLDYFGEHKLNYSVDFMLGLPFSYQWKRSIEKELEEIFRFSPKHLSLYILTVPKHYRHFSDLPDEEWIEREFLAVSRWLEERGFIHYEVSNFALPSFESQHNLAYWRGLTVGALGPSATGYFSKQALRYKWQVNAPEFAAEYLSASEKALEKLYMALRTSEGVNLFEHLPSIPPEKLEELISLWLERALVQHLGNKKVCPTSKGYLLLDSLMDDLFRLEEKSL